MTTNRASLKIHAPVPVDEPRGALALAALADALTTMLRSLRAAARTVASASRASRGCRVD